jgi:hypothetical protein
MTKYYIRVVEGNTGDEVGFVYQETPGVKVPEGYVAYVDAQSNHQLTEIIPAYEVKVISEAQYERIIRHAYEGNDPSHDIETVLDQVGGYFEDAEVTILRGKLEEFKRAAHNLNNAWIEADHDNEEKSGVLTNYPFAESFDELALKIIDWGVKDERNPLEKAVDYINSAKANTDYSDLLDPNMRYVDAVKLAMRVLLELNEGNKEFELREEVDKVNKLIDEL